MVIQPQYPQQWSTIHLVLFRENEIVPHLSQPPLSNLKIKAKNKLSLSSDHLKIVLENYS